MERIRVIGWLDVVVTSSGIGSFEEGAEAVEDMLMTFVHPLEKELHFQSPTFYFYVLDQRKMA